MPFKFKKIYKDIMYDSSTMKVITFACLIIVLSVFLMGTVSYMIVNNAVVKKLKSKDLLYIARSISSKVDGRIERALETSLILAKDPSIISWVEGSEKDDVLGNFVKSKITAIAKDYDYSNSFIVSAITNHYWAEGGVLIDTINKDDPDDSWFFTLMDSKKPMTIMIDYNNERKDTFVFINALIGDINKPLAVTGVGLNLKDISREFQSYKFGEKSNMWLIDNKGKIYISEDIEQVEKNISDFIPHSIAEKVLAGEAGKYSLGGVVDYENSQRQLYDLAYEPIRSTDWKLVLQIPRSESISVLNSIRVNTIAASFISIILIVFIFYMISNKIANPYKRALVLSQELERKVMERTQELNEKNARIMDSIEYAKVIQESILPPEEEFKKCFKDYFIIWKPRDVVGGDFYWLKRYDKGLLMAIGDCTGHGVPGALMTMTVNSILSHITDKISSDNPSLILKELNKLVRQTLHRNNSDKLAGDGLDIGILYISDRKLTFSGAGISLYIKDADSLNMFKCSNKGIGYKNLSEEFEFESHCMTIKGSEEFYITTDGYIDQNGGEKNFALGRKRFEQIICKSNNVPLQKQRQTLLFELNKYMNGETQRDDITVIGFKL